MDALKYKRTDVLVKLKENRSKHKADYDEVYKSFKKSVIEELEESLELAKSDKEYRLSLKQTEPTQHLRDYDRVISMLEMSSQDEIELDTNEFTSYVLDIWNWSNSFNHSKVLYSAKQVGFSK